MQEPRQLLEAFAQAEEANLFLIQAAQEAEEGLEAAAASLAAAKRRLGGEAAGLRAQVFACAKVEQEFGGLGLGIRTSLQPPVAAWAARPRGSARRRARKLQIRANDFGCAGQGLPTRLWLMHVCRRPHRHHCAGRCEKQAQWSLSRCPLCSVAAMA